MRSSLVALAVLSIGFAAPNAQAGALGWSGELAIRISTLDAISVNASGVATVNGSAVSGHLNSLALPASAFATAGLVVPVTDPAASPLSGVQVTAYNGAGSFVGGTGTGVLGGVMPLLGVAKVCLFAACSSAAANLSVPLSVVGNGGFATVTGAANVTVIGAPWTTGTASVGTLSAMGYAEGPGSLSSSTAQNSGTVRLVTPIFISTNLAGALPAFAFLTLHFVPEPATIALVGGGIAALVAFGRARRS